MSARAGGALFALVLLCSRAVAEPLVVVLDSPEAPPLDEFVSALELHIGRGATVRAGPMVEGGAVAARVSWAVDHAEEEGAALMVWIESGPAVGQEQTYVAYVVGRRPHRALLEVVRVRAGERAAAARVVALKVGSLIDLLLSAPAAEVDVVRGVHPVERPPPRRSRLRWGAAAEAVGALGAGTDQPRGGFGLVVGPALRGPTWGAAVHASARWLSETGARAELGEVRVGEAGASLGAGLDRRAGPLRIGVELGLGVRLLHARGVTENGDTDSALVASPTASAFVTGGVPLTPSLSLRAAAGLEISLIRRRFLLLERSAVDLGRYRPIARLALSWIGP